MIAFSLPRAPRHRAGLFDLDGTLLDTLGDLADAMNTALARLGFAGHPVRAYRAFIGDGVEALSARALPAEARESGMIRRCIDEMRIAYEQNWNQKTRPYSGIPEVLDALRRCDMPVAILSNKPDSFTQRIVDHYFRLERFVVVRGAREGVPRKPHPRGAIELAETIGGAPAEVLYVGDTDTDMRTAVAARMVPAGALWGFRGADELRRCGARLLLAQPRDVLRAVGF